MTKAQIDGLYFRVSIAFAVTVTFCATLEVKSQANDVSNAHGERSKATRLCLIPLNPGAVSVHDATSLLEMTFTAVAQF
jgi:hypothetical protein